MKQRLIYLTIYILIMSVFFLFIYDVRCANLSVTSIRIYNFIADIFMRFFPLILIFFFSKEMFLVNAFFCFIPHLIVLTICFTRVDSNLIKERPSMIIPTQVIKKQDHTSHHFKSQKVWLKGLGLYNDTSVVINSSLGKVGSTVYMQFSLECSLADTLLSITEPDSIRSQIHDFGFYEGENFYNYHDYSLRKTDLVYYKVGFNVIHNAVCGMVDNQDSTIMLCFNDVCGKYQNVKYSVKGYSTIPDTFLVYRNVNEKLDTKWHVCAPEVNTPENRAKITDYGYIFHYDVYSKQEIESQCPRIKDYVEQYKKRMSDNNTNTTESTAQEPE